MSMSRKAKIRQDGLKDASKVQDVRDHNECFTWDLIFNPSPPGQNGRHFAHDIFRCIFVNEKFCVLIKISLKSVCLGLSDNNPALVQIMAWRHGVSIAAHSNAASRTMAFTFAALPYRENYVIWIPCKENQRILICRPRRLYQGQIRAMHWINIDITVSIMDMDFLYRLAALISCSYNNLSWVT